MPIILWDASGLAKRYTHETGEETVDAVFASAPLSDMSITPWGYAETYSILLRKHHSGILSLATFNTAAVKLQNDVLGSSGFQVISISDATIFGSLSLMRAHSLNSADAAILAAFLRFQRALPASGSPCLLVASDKRLLRAAEAEGLKTLNPELLPAGDAAAFLAAL